MSSFSSPSFSLFMNLNAASSPFCCAGAAAAKASRQSPARPAAIRKRMGVPRWLLGDVLGGAFDAGGQGFDPLGHRVEHAGRGFVGRFVGGGVLLREMLLRVEPAAQLGGLV